VGGGGGGHLNKNAASIQHRVEKPNENQALIKLSDLKS